MANEITECGGMRGMELANRLESFARPGMRIGEFVLDRKLGEGGMGEVWLATQNSFGRKAAVKFLHTKTVDSTSISRFEREILMLGRLDHPNIVTAYSAGEVDGHRYIAMAYAEGETLQAWIDSGASISEAEILRIALDVASGLRHAWDSLRILHRDLKPSNIVIGTNGRVRILDLGISKSLELDSSLTLEGLSLGTPDYMSPEQAMADSDIDFRSDIYSLGATMYHALTGSPPFDGTTVAAVLLKHATQQPSDCRSINPAISESCAKLLARMMAKDKWIRPSSWAELEREMRSILHTPACRHRWIVFGGTLFAAVSLFFIIDFSVGVFNRSGKRIELENSIPKEFLNSKTDSPPPMAIMEQQPVRPSTALPLEVSVAPPSPEEYKSEIVKMFSLESIHADGLATVVAEFAKDAQDNFQRLRSGASDIAQTRKASAGSLKKTLVQAASIFSEKEMTQFKLYLLDVRLRLLKNDFPEMEKLIAHLADQPGGERPLKNFLIKRLSPESSQPTPAEGGVP